MQKEVFIISIVDTHPEIAKEFDLEKNNGRRPEDFSKGQTVTVWWKCKAGHSYQARVDHRCGMHSGCPYCAGKRPTPENNLAARFPIYAKEWDYSKNAKRPEDYLPFSNKEVWWICPLCGRSYKAMINARTSGNAACKCCIRESSTSFQEQAFCYYFSKVTTVSGREKVFGKEIDVYLPDLNTGIEYNGEYYHEQKTDKDNKKVSYLRENGIRIITVSCSRERRVSEDDIVIEAPYKSNPSEIELEWCINQVFKMLKLAAPEISLKSDSMDIYARYITTIKENSVAIKYPDLLKEWDNENNKGISPYSVPFGSEKTFHWKCDVCGGSYTMKVVKKTTGRQGCPYCAGKRILIGFNDLITTHPQLCKEWDHEKNKYGPEHYSKGSDYKAFWKCPTCGYSWKAAISSRSTGVGCPVCAGRVVISGVNDLATNCPEAATLWNYSKNSGLLPTQVTKGANKKVWWKCPVCKHEWKTTVSSVSAGRRCPECAKANRVSARNTTTLLSKGSLAQTHPELAKEWDFDKNGDLTPYDVTAGSKKQVWWKCKAGHSWQAVIYSRKHNGCPYCAGQIVVEGENDLVTIHPEILELWNYDKNVGLDPRSFKSHSNKIVWWKCPECGREWKTSINSVSSGRRCRICSMKRGDLTRTETVIARRGSLARRYPEIAKEWDYSKNGNLTPNDVSIGTHKKAWWICEKGHSWQAEIKTRRDCGCPICSGRILPGCNDLATNRPDLVKYWNYAKNDGIDPSRLGCNSKKKVFWKCPECGEEWQSMICNITKRKTIHKCKK